MTLRAPETKLVRSSEKRAAVIGALYVVFDDIFELLKTTRLSRPHEVVRLLMAARELVALSYRVEELDGTEARNPDLPPRDAEIKDVLTTIHDDVLTDLYDYIKTGAKTDKVNIWRPRLQYAKEKDLLIITLIAIDQLFTYADLDAWRRRWDKLRHKPIGELFRDLKAIQAARARDEMDLEVRLEMLRTREMLITVLTEKGFSKQVIDACSY